VKDDRADRTIDEFESSATAAMMAHAEPIDREGDDDYLLNDIGLALRVHGEWR